MTKIIAHRGANRHAPQNTVPAFKKALEIGCDGFENDIHLTADGHIVVCHNHTVDDTSNGSGKISEKTLAELRSLDFGSYFDKSFAGTKIPTLSEFLELCGGLDIINIEIKAPEKPNDIAAKTIDMVKAFGLLDSLLISSFSEEILLECKRYEPAVKTALLYCDNSPAYDEISRNPVEYVKRLGCSAVHPHYSEVDEAYIKAFHSAGIAVNPWTVDDEQTIKSFASWGCDSVITDVPDLAGEALNRAK